MQSHEFVWFVKNIMYCQGFYQTSLHVGCIPCLLLCLSHLIHNDQTINQLYYTIVNMAEHTSGHHVLYRDSCYPDGRLLP